jgi:hypothetical protein
MLSTLDDVQPFPGGSKEKYFKIFAMLDNICIANKQNPLSMSSNMATVTISFSKEQNKKLPSTAVSYHPMICQGESHQLLNQVLAVSAYSQNGALGYTLGMKAELQSNWMFVSAEYCNIVGNIAILIARLL